MNIQQASVHIRNTVTAYLEKGADGRFVIPVEKQRPLFLYGPPGIGKTAVIEQIAEEMGLGFVSYSMTHHTRQSALGLPFIKTVTYGDRELSVTEFTMSEILADVYAYMERTGKKQGILFLDEINCVSETLSPSMLRFLQYKKFGSHAVPDGWVIVTAGNPPEYNRSVREYDIATLDRIQRLDITADYPVWRAYAVEHAIHPAVLAYLDANPQAFYSIENTQDGKLFVTARGWEDLSRLMLSFERAGHPADAELIGEYVQVPEIASAFADFLHTFTELKELSDVTAVLDGRADPALPEKLRDAGVSERLGFLNLLGDALNGVLAPAPQRAEALRIAAGALQTGEPLPEPANDEERALFARVSGAEDKSAALHAELDALRPLVAEADRKLGNAADLVGAAFGDSPETKIFVSDVTGRSTSAAFLMHFGCDRFAALADTGVSEAALLKELEKLV